jgi:hypothetical protein
MSVKEEFALTGDALDEAQEMALAGNCRAMLVSFPAEFLLATLAEASTRCKTGSLLIVAVYFVIGSLLAFALYKVPTRYFRGRVRPFIWLIGFNGSWYCRSNRGFDAGCPAYLFVMRIEAASSTAATQS